MTFNELNLNKPLRNAIEYLGFENPTPIQQKSFNIIGSGRDIVGIAQTGTGKTFAYGLPILKNLPFSKQDNPRVLVLVPTRELVVQVVEELEKIAKYINVRIQGIYGGTNINTQKQMLEQGLDILVATPGRLYDLAISRALQLKSIQKLVIDEVDVMLDLGFRFQITNIFELLPQRRQNIMFSATMTKDVDKLISDFFINPERVSVALSGTPLDNISQSRYNIPNFYTKVNTLNKLIEDKELFSKVLIFVASKKMADRLFNLVEETFKGESSVIHSNKTQNYRLNSIQQFESGEHRILIATDVMARGLDIEDISHVINFDTPDFPENYIHRIGRTGRAEKEGISIVFSTEKEQEYINAIENLMQKQIALKAIPEDVELSNELLEEERPKIKERYNPLKRKEQKKGASYHEKKDKNKKENLGGSYKRKIKQKYKKPKTRGDKNYNKKKRRK